MQSEAPRRQWGNQSGTWGTGPPCPVLKGRGAVVRAPSSHPHGSLSDLADCGTGKDTPPTGVSEKFSFLHLNSFVGI